jgi:PAS domain S-box-containing protein
MSNDPFFEVAVKHLPGGLILADLEGHVRAVNETAETILGITEPVAAGTPCERAFTAHPKIAKILLETCRGLTSQNRQELTTVRPDGEKVVLGFGTLVLKDRRGNPVGVGMTFQDITRLIPLMDSHRFLDIALKNLPGGLIFVDLQGKVRGVNQMAQRLLALKEDIEPGTLAHQAFANHPAVVKVLLTTCHQLTAANRQEITTLGADGHKLVLGYGTLILRNPQGQPVGIGMTFQDITRFIPLPLQTEFIKLVDRFFTPFAATMVVASMWLGYAEKNIQYMALAIVTALVAFNEGSVYLARKHTEWTAAISYTRLATNFFTNIVLVYLLGTFWGPMWLLFVLTPVATALHADWKKTVVTSVLSAGALLGIYWSRGLEGPVGWGQASLHAAFIVFISLFVNSIARMVMQIKSAGPTAKPAPSSRPATADRSPAPVETQRRAA